MHSEDHEAKLIQALSRLEHSVFDNNLSGAEAPLVAAAIQEQFFAFSIGQAHFVVEADSFCAVFVETPIAAVPNAPPSLFGLSNIRGSLTPVYQLHLALDAVLPRKHFIFCIGKGDKTVGVLIDALPASLMLSKSDLFDAQLSDDLPALAHLINGFFLLEQKKYYLLDGKKIAEKLLAFSNQEHKQHLLQNSKKSLNQTAQL